MLFCWVHIMCIPMISLLARGVFVVVCHDALSNVLVSCCISLGWDDLRTVVLCFTVLSR